MNLVKTVKLTVFIDYNTFTITLGCLCMLMPQMTMVIIGNHQVLGLYSGHIGWPAIQTFPMK